MLIANEMIGRSGFVGPGIDALLFQPLSKVILCDSEVEIDKFWAHSVAFAGTFVLLLSRISLAQ